MGLMALRCLRVLCSPLPAVENHYKSGGQSKLVLKDDNNNNSCAIGTGEEYENYDELVAKSLH